MAVDVVNINVCGPFKLHSGLIGKFYAICHYSYNLRYGQVKLKPKRSAKAKGLTTQCYRNKIKKVETSDHFKKRGVSEKPYE